ncbi:MAG TPA: cation:proton antiporter, partial [Candidatus Limnocylindria bacterium]|nr:cation:proton antiporter [Candidatus Limnocylindria bacterium]
MEEVEIVLLLLALVAVLTVLARRVSVPYPILMTIGGLVIGLVLNQVPGAPHISLAPELVFLLFLPPILFSAAYFTSPHELKANARPIGLLAVGLVLVTTVAVGLILHALVPSMGWAAAFALGAIVSPPDAVSATAIAQRLGLPRRVVTILEGESLLNDATALVALNTALGAATVTVAWHTVGRDFVVAAGGGVLVGLVFFVVIGFVRKHVTDPVLDTGLSFLTPFAAYITAEEIHASGVISVVVAGLLLGHKSPILQTAQSRIAERLTWRSVAFLLESSVFLLIGLQARTIIGDAFGGEVSTGTIAAVCSATLVGVIVLRLVWVFFSRYFLVRPRADGGVGRPPWTYTF